MILPTVFDLASDQNLNHINFYRVDIEDNHLELIQRLNITTVPMIQWYFHGNKLDELIGVNQEEFINKTYQLSKIYKHKTTSNARLRTRSAISRSNDVLND